MSEKIEDYYNKQAKDMVDMLHDKRFLNDDLNRDSVAWLQDYIAFVMQTQANSAVKMHELTAHMRDKKLDK